MEVPASNTFPRQTLAYSELRPGPRGPRPYPVEGGAKSDWLLSFADRHRVKLFIILAGIYLLAFNGQWRLEPDSALYLTLGRNVANGEGFTYQDIPHRL